jgi:predicted TIM-barrel fold metal-dependent hydrolase
MTMTVRRRLLVFAAGVVAAAAIASLIAVPTARDLLAWGLQKAVAHWVLTVPLLGLAVIAVLAARKRPAWLAVLSLVAVGATASYGLVRMNARYPDNTLTDPRSFARIWRLVTGQDLLLSEYDPRPTLVVQRAVVDKARVPAIDIHFHLASLENVTAEQLVAAMDATGIQQLVNLDGAPGQFDRFSREFRDRYPDRFIQFAQLQFRFGPDFPDDQVSWIRLAASLGARGLKVTKSLGLSFRDPSGALVPLDDPRLDPIWQTAGALGLPVLIHVADPTPFWEPVDEHNERYEELREFPDWGYHDSTAVWNPALARQVRAAYPAKAELLRQRNNLVARHPGTTFIGAHMGERPEDLAALAHDLDTYPNFYVDISSRVPELGRQPYSARRFFIEYQDRILFGTDGGYAMGTTEWTPERYFRAYLEFLQTANENIEYPLWGVNRQGRWRVHALDLPDDVLRKVLHDNAASLLGSEPAGATTVE